jgi:hypothetical protein
MLYKSPEEVKKTVKQWLSDGEHSIKEVKDENTNFYFEIDYPVGQKTKQLLLQPRRAADLLVVSYPITISKEHMSGLHKMKYSQRQNLMDELWMELLFRESQFNFVYNREGIFSNVEFRCSIYFDGLNKNNLYHALNANFKAFLYLSFVLSKKLGRAPSTSSLPGYV